MSISVTAPVTAADVRPPEVEDLINRVAGLLYEGRAPEALRTIADARVRSPWAVNAQGVCELRRGNADQAIQIFRGLVIAGGGLLLRPDVPTTFKANLAAAQLAAGNVGGCLDTLADTQDEAHPAVRNVRSAVARWKASLSFWEKVGYYLGSEPSRPLPPDVQLGHL